MMSLNCKHSVFRKFRWIALGPTVVLVFGFSFYLAVPFIHSLIHDYYWGHGLHMGGRSFIMKAFPYSGAVMAALVVATATIMAPNKKLLIAKVTFLVGGVFSCFLLAMPNGFQIWAGTLLGGAIVVAIIYFSEKGLYNKFGVLLTSIIVVTVMVWISLPTPYHPIHKAVYNQDIKLVEKMLLEDSSLASQASQRTGLPLLFNSGSYKMDQLLIRL